MSAMINSSVFLLVLLVSCIVPCSSGFYKTLPLPVEDFSRDMICRHHGYIEAVGCLANEMLCYNNPLQETFYQDYIRDLCKKNLPLLERWVARLLGLDDDEYISAIEDSILKQFVN